MEKRINLKKEVFQWSFSIGIACILALTLRTYVFASADVDGYSMLPTLNDKDRIFVEKVSMFTHTFNPGEIIIFDSGNAKDDIYVKRVIAVEGDTVELKDGKVFVNDKQLDEPYLSENTLTKPGTFLKDNQKLTIQKGYVFVLGDNREVSLDSRYLGPIKISAIKGHVILRAYPFNEIKGF